MCSYAHKRASKSSPPLLEVLKCVENATRDGQMLICDRQTSSDEEDKGFRGPETNATAAELPALATNNELRDLGYLPNEQNLLCRNAAPNSLNPVSSNTMSAEMKNALQLLPPKPYTGDYQL